MALPAPPSVEPLRLLGKASARICNEILPIAYRGRQGVHFLDIYKSNRSQIRFIRGWHTQS